MADQVTPVSVLAAKWPESRSCFLLESVEGGERLGRYSIVSADPEAILLERNGITERLSPDGKVLDRAHTSAVAYLRAYMEDVRPAVPKNVPRFFGGAVGFCSYEHAHSIERLPMSNPDRLGWPVSGFFITGDLFVFDNTQRILKLTTCARIAKGESPERAYRRAEARLKKNLAWLRRAASKPLPPPRTRRTPSAAFRTNLDRRAYMTAVRRAKDYIGRGDIIQVVLSRRSERRTSASPLDIYRALRVVNPSPYMYLMRFGDRSIIGSSPELLVRLENGVAATRPIAGTRRRGGSEAEDQRLERDLLADPKERAEHVMLVDLGRNDLGRVCAYGSVTIPTRMKVERFSHVMHIVSEVAGRLKQGHDAFDLLDAAFPAGTVSGAPKIRAMEIIDELEPDRRGPYAGALGYVSYDGSMDFAITIRTVLWDRGVASIQAGAGIVADSDPAREFKETESKAAALKETIRMAESGPLFWERS